MPQLYLFEKFEEPYVAHVSELEIVPVGLKLFESGMQKQSVGPNYKGLCVFHDERSPSFYLKPKPNMFICYGCLQLGGPLRLIFEQARDPWDFLFRTSRLNLECDDDLGLLIDAIHAEEDKFGRDVISPLLRHQLFE